MLKKSPKYQYALNLWRKLIQETFAGRCAACHNQGHHCHHIIPAGFIHYSLAPENGILLCVNCHARAHAAGGSEWLDGIIKERLPQWFSQIEYNRTHHENRTFTDQDLRDAVERIRKTLTAFHQYQFGQN